MMMETGIEEEISLAEVIEATIETEGRDHRTGMVATANQLPL